MRYAVCGNPHETQVERARSQLGEPAPNWVSPLPMVAALTNGRCSADVSWAAPPLARPVTWDPHVKKRGTTSATRSPSRRSQVVVRRGQWRQMPRGSSTRSSLQSIAMARRAQCLRRTLVRRARPSRTAAVSNAIAPSMALSPPPPPPRSLHPYPSISNTSSAVSSHHSPASAVTGSPLPTHTHSTMLAGCVRVLTRPVALGQVPAWRPQWRWRSSRLSRCWRMDRSRPGWWRWVAAWRVLRRRAPRAR